MNRILNKILIGFLALPILFFGYGAIASGLFYLKSNEDESLRFFTYVIVCCG